MREGFIKEYEYYKISNEIEKEWLKDMKQTNYKNNWKICPPPSMAPGKKNYCA
jgi:hypothetical protein